MSEKKSLEDGINKFLNNNKDQILIIRTDQKENPLALQRFFKYLNDV